MALREDFEISGNWLFRWRSYLPVVLIGIFFLALREYEYPGGSEFSHHLWEMICIFVSFLGLGVRVLTIGFTPVGTSGRNTKHQIADTLNTTGIYSIVRNPLYLGNFFMGLGVALFADFWWLTLIYILAFTLYYERIIFAEEAYLRNKFGETYMDWADKTPAIIPSVTNFSPPVLPFSLKNVLRREYNGFFAVVILLFILEMAGDFFYLGEIRLDVSWVVLVVTSFVIWMVLRSLKKYTTFLEVEGR